MVMMTETEYSDWLKKASKSSSCGAKKFYATESEASSSASRRSAETGTTLSAYRCRYCVGWHMGHRPEPSLFGIEIIDPPKNRNQRHVGHALNMKFS